MPCSHARPVVARARCSRLLAISAILVAVASFTVLAQPRQPAFRARTVVTELEVHVTDAQGRSVTGLTRDDFEVREDDVVQDLLEVESRGPAPAIGAPPASAARPVVAAGAQAQGPTVVVATNQQGTDTRAWALVVDDLRTPGFLRAQVKACLQALVDGLPANDYVALVPTSGDRRAAREFTRDRGMLREAIEALRFTREFDGLRVPVFTGTLEHPRELVGPPPPAPPRLDLTAADNLLISSVGNAAAMLGRAGAARGTLVLLSRGMGVALTDDHGRALLAVGGGSALARYDEWTEVLTRVQRSGTVLHVVDPTRFDPGLARRTATSDRLMGGPTARMREFVSADDPRAATRVIARGSGGVYVEAPDAMAAARSVLAATTGGYILRYMPTRDAVDDVLRQVQVRVRRADLTVRARSAYARVSDPAFEALRSEKPLGVAVAAALPSSDLALEATVDVRSSGSKSEVQVGLQVTGTPGAPVPPRDVLEVLGIVVDMKGKTVAKAGGRTDVAEGGPRRPQELVLGPLSPGRYQLRVAVRSAALDRTGSVFLDVVIPAPR